MHEQVRLRALMDDPGRYSTRRFAVAAAVAAAGAMFLLVAGCGGNDVGGCRLRSVDKAAYVAKNEAILRTIPVYPGSKLIESYSAGQPAPNACLPRENSPPYDKFVTIHRYLKPNKMPRGKIVRFYRKALTPKWQLRGYTLAEPPWDSTFRHGYASLYVSESDTGWDIRVDHDVDRPRQR